MNKYQEALEKLRLLDCYDEENFEIKFENLPILQELVDKATPKKLYTRTNLTNKICPRCHLIFGLDKYDRYEKHNHCPSCGQALDWSEDGGE